MLRTIIIVKNEENSYIIISFYGRSAFVEMKRSAVSELIKWKENGTSVPFLLVGTKGTGKTYLAIEFSLAYYPQYLYVNFELNKAANDFFTDKILSGYSVAETVATFFQIEERYLSELVVIFDEVSFCPTLFEALKGKEPFAVIAISGVTTSLQNKEHFHVCHLFPLGFDEFLSAVGSDWYIDIIQGHFQQLKPVPDIVHQELMALFEEYLVVGGMPAAINEYISSKSVNNVSEIHYNILNRMESVMEHICDEKKAGKAKQIMQVLSEQLMRENKKFRFNSIRKGVTYALYQDSILALEECGMVLRLNEQSKTTHFKLYLPDVGMLSSAFDGIETEETRKALLENYVMQTLVGKEQYQLKFWESDAQAKLEFILQKDNEETPVELRTSTNGKGKSIASFQNIKGKQGQKYYRFGFENFYSTSVLLQVPYYAIFCL